MFYQIGCRHRTVPLELLSTCVYDANFVRNHSRNDLIVNGRILSETINNIIRPPTGPRSGPGWPKHVMMGDNGRLAGYTLRDLASLGYLRCILGDNFSPNLNH